MLDIAAAGASLAFLLACAAKLTLILAFAWLAVFVLRRNSSALRHHVWAAAIVAAFLLPFCVALLPVWHSKTLGAAAAALGASRGPASIATAPQIPAVVVHAGAGSPQFGAFAVAAVLVWALGLVFFSTRLLAGLGLLAWLSARSRPLFEDVWMRDALNLSNSLGISRSVRLLECNNPLAMPLAYGVFRPVVLLPAGAAQWTEGRRRVVLSHELAHIARNDWFLQICAEVVRALHWFHPLVWLAATRLRQESERACDDAALRSGVAPAQYASQLLDLARTLKNSGRTWSTALAIARPTNLERRFAAMLNPSVNRRRLSVKAKCLIPMFAMFILLPLAALRLPAQNLAGKTSGSVHDASGTGVANATIVMTHQAADISDMTIDMTTTDRDGNFSFQGLRAGKYELEIYKPGFQTYRQADVSLGAGRDFTAVFTLDVGAITEHVMVVPEGAGKPVVTERTNGKPSRLGVGGTVEAAKLIKKVQPVYPESARSAGISGTVVLHAVISKDGRPLSLRVMNGQVDPDLAKSAVEAVSQWRYTPTLLNGEPVEIDTTIEVVYSLRA